MAIDTVVLVTGAGGQLGSALRAEFPNGRFPTRAELDVTDVAAVDEAVGGVDAVIHLAAMTDVDRCEADPDAARRVNVDGTTNVAEAARRHAARLIYLSTDYVFDGLHAGEYAEDHEPRPINVYGATKLAGESIVREDETSLVVRTSWLVGEGRNFVRAILEAAARGSVAVVADQRGRPTFAPALASALAQAVERDTTGILHLAGDGPPCTRAELAELSLSIAGIRAQVRRIDTATYVRSRPGPTAPRPPNSTLSLDRARAAGLPLVDWRESLTRYLERA